MFVQSAICGEKYFADLNTDCILTPAGARRETQGRPIWASLRFPYNPVFLIFMQKILAVRKTVVSLRRQHPPSLLTMLKSAGRFFIYSYESQLY
jgi:hypothetical protein